VEASSDMLSIASERISGETGDQLKFIHGNEESIPEGIVFDVIITHFLLDLFSNEKGLALCRNLYRNLQSGGLWLISDFVDGGKWWQRVMLWMMYRFFVLTCRIEATTLPPWEYQLRTAGMRERVFKLFFSGFIKSVVYRKEAGL
jgi:ubiquinone/menaquinone biosynthesis C-methylase UbiE